MKRYGCGSKRWIDSSVTFHQRTMSKLQVLSVFLTERLTLAAQEIFKAVEDVFSEYNEDICRSRLEIELLKRRLQQTGVQMDSETQSRSSETQGQKCTQTFSEDSKDTEMQLKLEVYTQPEENEVDMPVCGESASLSPCVDIYHDQTPSKDTETQVMDSSESNCHFIEQAARIKNEPETKTETGTTCQIQQNITKQDFDNSEASNASSDVNKVKVSHIGSPRHETQTFNLPLRNQEMLTKHRMELAQIRDRLADEERKKAAAKARSLKHKQKVYRNPELREAYRKKERERYQRRKSQGKVKSAKDLNPIELRRQQKKWRDNSASYRRKQTFQEVLVNTKEDINQVIPVPATTSSAQHYAVFNIN
ncbi:uncharacterized protein LOC132126302 isoform X2 [Carassius carassius]|uniref:uncharacterized protein LOC132126302 isoform X2 n=1 Tax=Carassius carassius TaxID=217509 RepID=UPI0028692D49|nr:uncharacterized protein LOC132126302 isoform X2 [Carassius carassius]